MEDRNVRNVAGRGAREMARSRYRLRLIVALLCLAGLACIKFAGLPVRTIPALLCCFAALALIDKTCVPLMGFLKKRERHASRGAEAEEAVADNLAQLSAEHLILHDIMSAYGNIDHVIIRQDGAVFSIETKSHRGRVTEHNGELCRNGMSFEKDFLRQASRNARWLKEFIQERLGLTVWVHSAIVFPNAYVGIRKPIRGVDILYGGYLKRWMAKASGNPEVAEKLWSEKGRLKHEFLGASVAK